MIRSQQGADYRLRAGDVSAPVEAGWENGMLAAIFPRKDRLMPNSLETRFERMLLMSRWLLVPLYLVVLLLLLGFAFKAILELVHLFGSLMSISETDLVLAALSLIDLALVGDLAVMVALSGYETMVSRIDATPEMEKPNWLGKYDSGTIKLKVASSLVAISGIRLLKTYLNSAGVPLDRMLVMTAVHLAFVISALILAYVDKIAFASHREQGH